MTAYSMTVTNSVRAFGGGPTSLWNAYNWNAFKWGDGTTKVYISVRKQVTNTLTPDSARFFRLQKLLTMQSLAIVSESDESLTKGVSNTLAPTSAIDHIYVIDGAGYYRLFPGGKSDAEDQATANWASGTASSTTWTAAATPSTTWSAA